jgi:hypothetical protein
MIMWQTCGDRLREAENSRIARQGRTGRRRHFHLLAWARARSERCLSMLGTAPQGHFGSAVEEAAKVSGSGGGLIM